MAANVNSTFVSYQCPPDQSSHTQSLPYFANNNVVLLATSSPWLLALKDASRPWAIQCPRLSGEWLGSPRPPKRQATSCGVLPRPSQTPTGTFGQGGVLCTALSPLFSSGPCVLGPTPASLRGRKSFARSELKWWSPDGRALGFGAVLLFRSRHISLSGTYCQYWLPLEGRPGAVKGDVTAWPTSTRERRSSPPLERQ